MRPRRCSRSTSSPPPERDVDASPNPYAGNTASTARDHRGYSRLDKRILTGHSERLAQLPLVASRCQTEHVTVALAAILIVVLIAIAFVLRHNEAVRNGEREPASGKQIALVAGVVAINTIPFAPIWPGTSGGDGFVQDWIMIFVLLSLPFWLIALAVWRTCRKLPPRKRCVVAELPAFVLQAGMWSLGYPQAVAVFIVIRAVDGVLLYRLARPVSRDVPAVSASAA